MVKDGSTSLVMRGSTSINDVEEMLGVHFGETSDETVTTIAGLLSHVSGKVPAPGEKFDLEGFRFEVLEANQRKVLRVKAQKLTGTAMHAG
jgi:CBS domain containing-hemolysin-like protein